MNHIFAGLTFANIAHDFANELNDSLEDLEKGFFKQSDQIRSKIADSREVVNTTNIKMTSLQRVLHEIYVIADMCNEKSETLSEGKLILMNRIRKQVAKICNFSFILSSKL